MQAIKSKSTNTKKKNRILRYAKTKVVHDCTTAQTQQTSTAQPLMVYSYRVDQDLLLLYGQPGSQMRYSPSRLVGVF